MEVEAFFFNNGKLFKGIIEVGRWDKAEDAWKLCEDAMDGGKLIFIRILNLNDWRISQNMDYEAYSYSKWDGRSEVLSEFKAMIEIYGKKSIPTFVYDLTDENIDKFNILLKNYSAAMMADSMLAEMRLQMKQLINELRQPRQLSDNTIVQPSSLQRRAAQAIEKLVQLQQSDLQGRLLAEQLYINQLKQQDTKLNWLDAYNEIYTPSATPSI